MSEIDLEGEGPGVEAAIRFARAGEVDAQCRVPPEGDAVLHADRGRRVLLSQELPDAARVGVDPPARRRIDERADTRARADRMSVVELMMHVERRFGEAVHHRAVVRALPGRAGAAIQAGHQRLVAVLDERAPPAARDAPGARLEEIVARGEWKDVDRDEAFEACCGTGAMAGSPVAG